MRASRSSRSSWMSFSCAMKVPPPSAAEKSATAESKGMVDNRSTANQKETYEVMIWRVLQGGSRGHAHESRAVGGKDGAQSLRGGGHLD